MRLFNQLLRSYYYCGWYREVGACLTRAALQWLHVSVFPRLGYLLLTHALLSSSGNSLSVPALLLPLPLALLFNE